MAKVRVYELAKKLNLASADILHYAKDLGIEKVEMIPDGTGMFTRDMNMLVYKPRQGFGYRSWRYAMVVDNKKVEKMFVEPGLNNQSLDDDPYIESTPDKVLEYLEAN